MNNNPRYYTGVPREDYDAEVEYSRNNNQMGYTDDQNQYQYELEQQRFELEQQQEYQKQQEFELEQQQRQQQQQYQKQQQVEEEREPYYFQYKKIQNTGFWGDVRRRRGTWLVAFGGISFCLSIVMIAISWRWWWGPEVNVPCRVAGITLLIIGVFLIVGGLISNAFMFRNPESKHFLGSPPRWSSWLLFVGLGSLVIASDFMTFYYSYWHNRFVNTPFISLSIILFFFGTIFVIVGLRYNFKEMEKFYELKLQQPNKQNVQNL